MPFINSKVTIKISEDKVNILKARLGEAITILGKSESWLMLNFEDDCKMYFQGNSENESAIVQVELFGSATKESYNKLTSVITKIYNEELNISPNRIFVTYREVQNWGWNGNNF